MYDPDERVNKLADDVDMNAPLSRLTLFSPCKVSSSCISSFVYSHSKFLYSFMH